MARGEPDRPAQHWDPARYQRNAGFVAVLGEPLLQLLQPRPGQRILDLGCGDGALTMKLAASGAKVVAVDQSAEQAAAARVRGLDARVADGARLGFAAEFDGVFSNAALHWMREADAVIDGVFRALKPGGRFVAEMGGAGNVAKVLEAAVGALERRGIDGRAAVPWYFPSVAEYRGKLERRGFAVRTIELFARPTRIPGEIGAWLETFGEAFISRVPPSERPAYLAEVAQRLAPQLRDAEGWSVDYVRLRFAAAKPA
jgi:SAM-dependent methyltransferase